MVGLFLVLTERVIFKTMFQKGNRVQVPRRIRWRFKMDSRQVLRAKVYVVGHYGVFQTFYTQMGKDGRITIPWIQRKLLKDKRITTLEHRIIEVTLEPA